MTDLIRAWKAGAHYGFSRKYPGLFPSDDEILRMVEDQPAEARPSNSPETATEPGGEAALTHPSPPRLSGTEEGGDA